MDFKGHVEKGWIRPTKPISLPDGTAVTFKRWTGSSKTNRSSAGTQPIRNWTSRPLKDLVREQGTVPLRIGSLAGDWPKGESIDEFIKSLRKGRK